MKKLLLVLLLGVVAQASAESYPDSDRFVEYNVKGTSAYIVKDTKTGCEYLSGSAAASSYTLIEGSCTNLPDGTRK